MLARQRKPLIQVAYLEDKSKLNEYIYTLDCWHYFVKSLWLQQLLWDGATFWHFLYQSQLINELEARELNGDLKSKKKEKTI